MAAKKKRVEALKPDDRKKLKNQFNQPKYTFIVDRRANKHQIGMAVHELYKVVVVAVNTLNGTTKRGRKLTKFPRAPRDYKKAVVTLREGERIETI
ncbi:MAG: 50S ribosomal protein L23 [Pedosphaera sp.]|nr:50S ribosomal protein L23 [Pedosphaera sp.]MSU42759.1 50S ribosomal protein L23 [Pedosphaera sp.]